MTINILLTGGRAPATYYLARLLKAQGYRLFMAESISHHLCNYSNLFEGTFFVTAPNMNQAKYIDDLQCIVKEQNIQLLIPTCEEVFHIAMHYERLARACEVFCEPIDLLQALHHKGRFIETLGDFMKWVQKPKTIELTEDMLTHKEQLIQSLSNQIDLQKQYVCKPVYSRFGNDVLFVNGVDVANVLAGKQEAWVVQEKIEGKQICTYAIAKKGKLLAYSAYATNDSVGVGATVYFAPYADVRLQQFVEAYVEKHSYTGQIAFDFICTKEQELFPIECNPRLTSGICLFPIQRYEEGRMYVGCETTMVGLAMLSTFRPGKFAEQLRKMKQARDIVWNRQDKRAFWGQMISFLALWREARKRGLTTYAMSTADIEWNGEESK